MNEEKKLAVIINNMNYGDKLKIYMDYYITQIGMRKIPFIEKTFKNVNRKEKININYRDKNGNEIGGIEEKIYEEEICISNFKWIDGVCLPMSFEEFISKSNLIEIDTTKDQYKIDHGYAIGKWTEYKGIYDWYWKFNKRIKL